MSNDHVAIPRLIQNGFTKNGKVVSYDLALQRQRLSPISKLGTEEDYYDEDVEKDLLANQIENEFSKFYHDFTSTTNCDYMVEITTNNTKLIEQFLSFMYMRAKRVLADINENGLSAKVFGEIDHSELLRIQTHILVNPLEMIGKEYKILPVINFSKTKFINNSLGFAIIYGKNNKISFFLPLNTRVGLFIAAKSSSEKEDLYYIHLNDTVRAKLLNQSIVSFEKTYGNGYFFGETKDDMSEYIAFYKRLCKPV